MAFVNSDDTKRSYLPRVDAHGKTWLNAYSSHGKSTAHYPVVLRMAYDGTSRFGWKAVAIFDTGLASATAMCRCHQHFVGVPRDDISSSTWGWYQIGGDCPTVYCDAGAINGTVGGFFTWKDASVACGTAGASTTLPSIANFAVCQVGDSATCIHSMYLIGQPVCGIT